MRKLNEYVIVIFFLIILFFIFADILLQDTNFYSYFEPSDWLNVIATILTLGVTIFIFELGDKRAKKIIEQENNPIVVLGITNYKEIDISNVVDLEDSEVPINEMKNDSNIEIPLINGGRTPIFNITYSYEVENIEAIKVFYKENEKIIKQKIPTLSFPEKRLYGENFVNVLSYFYRYEGEKYKRKEFLMASFSRAIPAIMPHQEAPVNLPMFFSVLLYDYFINPQMEEMPIPTLKMFLFYDDSNMKQHKEEFLIKLAQSSVNRNKVLNYTLIGSKKNILKQKQ